MFILRFPLRYVECTILAQLGEGRIAFMCLSALLRGQQAAWETFLDKQCVLLQKCPWWQIIHYSCMDEYILFVPLFALATSKGWVGGGIQFSEQTLYNCQ